MYDTIFLDQSYYDLSTKQQCMKGLSQYNSIPFQADNIQQ